MIDGTPVDWLQNGKKCSLHLAIDDATGEILSGYFMPTECLEGYCNMLKILIQKHGIPENIYSDRHTILKSRDDKNISQFGRMCNELGINQIFALSPQAKEKIEKMNDTLQGRLLNDIIRYNIKNYAQLNIFFNKTYAKYINKKFAYSPKEQESAFIKIPKSTNLDNIFCIKEERQILNGCIFSYSNNHYQLIDKSKNIIKPFKGSKIIVLENVFSHSIKAEYKKVVYDTIRIEGHRMDNVKRQQEIQNQKELEQYLDSLYNNT